MKALIQPQARGSNSILHVGLMDKFPQQMLMFLDDHGQLDGHYFIAKKVKGQSPPERLSQHMKVCGSIALAWEFVIRGFTADKIIVHSFLCRKTLWLLMLQPWLLKKSCWILWGGDLYAYRERHSSLRARRHELLRRYLIRRVPQICSATPGDGDLCRYWYRASGEYLNIFTYPNSIIPLRHIAPRDPRAPLKLMVGNNAYCSNHHLEVFDLLKRHDDGRFEIYCPLAYGNSDYRERVVRHGSDCFGSRFHPQYEMLPLEKYIDFLAGIDIAIFNNDRQQGMGNIRSLIGFGKKVYMRSGVTSWDHMRSLGVKVFDICDFDLHAEFSEAAENRRLMCSIYSESAYMQGLDKLFTPIRTESHST